jgi:hypothetical protein
VACEHTPHNRAIDDEEAINLIQCRFTRGKLRLIREYNVNSGGLLEHRSVPGALDRCSAYHRNPNDGVTILRTSASTREARLVPTHAGTALSPDARHDTHPGYDDNQLIRTV